PLADPDDGGGCLDSRRPAFRDDGRCRIGRNPQPGELHAAGDGPKFAFVWLAGERGRRGNAHCFACPSRDVRCAGLRERCPTGTARQELAAVGRRARYHRRRRSRGSGTGAAGTRIVSYPAPPASRRSQTMSAGEHHHHQLHHHRYRFGPLERRGVVGSLRASQVVVIGVCLSAGVVLMRTIATEIGIVFAVVLALTAILICFWPISGRSAEEWLPVVGRHVGRRARGQHQSLSPAPQAGVRHGEDGRPEPLVGLPEAAKDLELLAAPFRGETVGVVKDRRTRTFTAALAVKVTSFGLLDRAAQQSRQAGWGSVLSGLAREGSPVSRIQWIERTVPADGDEIGRYLAEAWERETVPLDSLSMQSYLELTSTAPAITTDHELFVCLQIDAKLAWRQIKRAGGKQGADAGACSVLLRELEALAERLVAADVHVVGALRPGMLATAFRVGFDPWSRPGLARLAAADSDRDGIDDATAWPTATETSWGSYRAGGAVHATYWISSWPRIDVGPAFLSPL